MPDENNGLVYGSLSIPKDKNLKSFSIYYKKKNGKEISSQRISFNGTQQPFSIYAEQNPDFEDEHHNIFLFAIELEKGAYEFYKITYAPPLWGGGNLTVYTSPEFSLNFEINGGKINYVGNYTFYKDGNKDGTFLSVLSQKDTDDEFFTKKRESISWKNSIDMTPTNSSDVGIEVK